MCQSVSCSICLLTHFLLHNTCCAADSPFISFPPCVLETSRSSLSISPGQEPSLSLARCFHTIYSLFKEKLLELPIVSSINSLEVFSMGSKMEVLKKYKIVVVLHSIQWCFRKKKKRLLEFVKLF